MKEGSFKRYILNDSIHTTQLKRHNIEKLNKWLPGLEKGMAVIDEHRGVLNWCNFYIWNVVVVTQVYIAIKI